MYKSYSKKMSIHMASKGYKCHGVKIIQRVYLSTKLLDAQILGIGVTAIFCRSSSLLGGPASKHQGHSSRRFWNQAYLRQVKYFSEYKKSTRQTNCTYAITCCASIHWSIWDQFFDIHSPENWWESHFACHRPPAVMNDFVKLVTSLYTTMAVSDRKSTYRQASSDFQLHQL